MQYKLTIGKDIMSVKDAIYMTAETIVKQVKDLQDVRYYAEICSFGDHEVMISDDQVSFSIIIPLHDTCNMYNIAFLLFVMCLTYHVKGSDITIEWDEEISVQKWKDVKTIKINKT